MTDFSLTLNDVSWLFLTHSVTFIWLLFDFSWLISWLSLTYEVDKSQSKSLTIIDSVLTNIWLVLVNVKSKDNNQKPMSWLFRLTFFNQNLTSSVDSQSSKMTKSQEKSSDHIMTLTDLSLTKTWLLQSTHSHQKRPKVWKSQVTIQWLLTDHFLTLLIYWGSWCWHIWPLVQSAPVRCGSHTPFLGSHGPVCSPRCIWWMRQECTCPPHRCYGAGS